MFKQLFGGGSAKLVQPTTKTSLKLGIEIMQPAHPGKKLQSISATIWWGANYDRSSSSFLSLSKLKLQPILCSEMS